MTEKFDRTEVHELHFQGIPTGSADGIQPAAGEKVWSPFNAAMRTATADGL